MTLFLAILLGHLLYDFHWQGPFIAEFKGKKRFILFIHSLTWALFLSAILFFFGAFAPWKFAFLLITHYFCDGWKSRLPKTDDYFWAIYVDQGIHLLTMLVVLL